MIVSLFCSLVYSRYIASCLAAMRKVEQSKRVFKNMKTDIIKMMVSLRAAMCLGYTRLTNKSRVCGGDEDGRCRYEDMKKSLSPPYIGGFVNLHVFWVVILYLKE